MNIDTTKKLAAEKAVAEIKDGMTIGLGTGSTFHFALLKIAERIKSGELKNIICVSSSKQTEIKAAELGIPLITLNDLYKSHQLSALNERGLNENHSQFSILNSQLLIDITIDGTDEATEGRPERSEESKELKLIDLTIDGADEVDEKLNLIKGGGGALLREKIVVQASKKFIVVVDESKLSKNLGMNFSVPVEVLQFAVETEKCFLESLGAKTAIRKNSDGEQLVTDEGNFILDAKVNSIANVNEFASLLEQRAGIVEHGLFRNKLVSKVVCSFSDGSIKELLSN